MSEYAVVLEQSKSGSWSAYVPDLPGCTAGGDQPEEAMDAIKTSIELWVEEAKFEGLDVPPPSSQARTVVVVV